MNEYFLHCQFKLLSIYSPITISNTYFLDRCLGWHGICVEANPSYFEMIHRERSCALVPTCVSEKDGEVVQFASSRAFGGIIATHSRTSRVMNDSRTIVEKKRCVSVRSQLERFDVSDIDYFNLDVEGGELNVLKSIDWEVTKFRLITVEVSRRTAKPIDDFLKQVGYTNFDTEKSVNGLEGVKMHITNKLYIHESIKLGAP